MTFRNASLDLVWNCLRHHRDAIDDRTNRSAQRTACTLYIQRHHGDSYKLSSSHYVDQQVYFTFHLFSALYLYNLLKDRPTMGRGLRWIAEVMVIEWRLSQTLITFPTISGKAKITVPNRKFPLLSLSFIWPMCRVGRWTVSYPNPAVFSPIVYTFLYSPQWLDAFCFSYVMFSGCSQKKLRCLVVRYNIAICTTYRDYAFFWYS